MREHDSSPRSGAEGASSILISFLARTKGIAMTLSDICSHSAATRCACHLDTTGRITLRRNLLDAAKTNMFTQLNRMYESFTLFETPLTDSPMIVVSDCLIVIIFVEWCVCTNVSQNQHVQNTDVFLCSKSVLFCLIKKILECALYLM